MRWLRNWSQARSVRVWIDLPLNRKGILLRGKKVRNQETNV